MSITIQVHSNLENKLIPVTLSAGEEFVETSGGQTDEGYDYQFINIHHVGTHLVMECARDASDCDGRVQTQTDYEWVLDGELQESGVPVWVHEGSTQRDHAAEAAGY